VIAIAWLVELAALAYRDWTNPQPVKLRGGGTVQRGKGLIFPSEILATFIIFGTLSLAEQSSLAPVATAVAWGFVLATGLTLWNPASPLTLQQKGAAA
jgi:hypothetical protein